MSLFAPDKPRTRRLWLVIAVLLAGGSAAALVMNAFQANLVFFLSPSQVMADEHPQDRNFRLGGLVVPGSLQRADGGLQAMFVLTDNVNRVPVIYAGILPDLFGEGQGAVALGRMDKGRFVAEQVLAKHDENYMPPEVAAMLAQSGVRTGASQP